MLGNQSKFLIAALVTAWLTGVAAEGTGKGCLANYTSCCYGQGSSSCRPCPAGANDVSPLFGCWGGYFKAGEGRLPYDWSYAGYRMGEVGLPSRLKVAGNVQKDFGAKGDGRTDDTQAFKNAFAKLGGSGVLYIPAGRYVITQALQRWGKPLVLVGAGQDKTTLYFPKSLTQIYGNKYREGGSCCTSDWSHSGAFIQYAASDPAIEYGSGKTLLARVDRDAKKGDSQLHVSSTKLLKKGMLVRLHVADPGDNNATNTMLGGRAGGLMVAKGQDILGSYGTHRFFTRISEIKAGNVVVLERNLPTDVYAYWRASLHSIKWNMQNSGVQDLTLEFPPTNYPGHLKELGYNALFFRQVSNGWIRRVRILNSDSGIYCWGCNFVTMADVEVATTKSRGKEGAGHRAIWLEHGTHSLVTRFLIQDIFKHDLSVSSFEQGSVFSEGYGKDLCLDFHRSAPFGNLYTNLHFGATKRAFLSSGSPANGPHAGAYNTIWSVVGAADRVALPYTGAYRWQADPAGPMFNFVDLAGSGSASRGLPYSWHFEAFTRRGLHPSNLHQALVRRRLGAGASMRVGMADGADASRAPAGKGEPKAGDWVYDSQEALMVGPLQDTRKRPARAAASARHAPGTASLAKRSSLPTT